MIKYLMMYAAEFCLVHKVLRHRHDAAYFPANSVSGRYQ